MKGISTELKVGFFAIIVIIILSYMTFKVGRLTFMWEKGYRVYAVFDDINGLDERSRVKIAGVDAGIVETITLEGGRARLTLLMNPDVKLYKDAAISLKMAGMLGDRYLSVETGSPDQPLLKTGDSITNVLHAADIDKLAHELTSAATYIGDLAENLKDTFGQSERDALSEAIHNLREVTLNLKDMSAENREPLHSIIVRLEKFSGALADKGPGFMDDMSKAAKSFGDKGPKLIDDLSVLAKDLRQMADENRGALKESLENMKTASRSASNIAQKIESGEGTIGKLVQDEKLYAAISKVSEQAGKSMDVVGGLKTIMDFHSEYNTGEGEWKGYFDLTLQPRKDKYYILGVVSDPKGAVETTDITVNGVNSTEDEVTSKMEFSAQFAKRFQDVALRIGMTENTFGLGGDYFFNDDKGRVKMDIWDFSAKEAEAERAHARIGIDYRIFKYVFVSSGIDNILNSDRMGIYVGGGVQFEDEDFKYIFGKPGNLPLP